MCSFQQLYYHETIGYVLRCRGCRNIQIGFGNVMLTLEEQVLPDFHHILKANAWEWEGFAGDSLRNIQVPMPYAGISLLLTKNELHAFIRMLDTADTELKSISIMELFRK